MPPKTEASVPADPKRNLHQRLAAIASEVKVTATGTTGRAAGNQRAISIGDVDEALGPLFVKHGVVSDYQFKDEPKSFKVPTRDGEMTMWIVGIQAHIYNADDPQDSLIRVLNDIGSNPSAAVSFALKRWYRALFKLVEDDDDAPRVAPTARPASAPVGTDGSNGSGSDDVIPKTLQDLADSLPKGMVQSEAAREGRRARPRQGAGRADRGAQNPVRRELPAHSTGGRMSRVVFSWAAECGSKKPYASKHKAKLAARWAECRLACGHLVAYRCSWSDPGDPHWHCGHKAAKAAVEAALQQLAKRQRRSEFSAGETR